MKRHATLAFVLVTLSIAGCSALFAQEELNPAAKPEIKVANWYKVEIAMNEFQDGKKTNTRSYTLGVEERGSPLRSTMKLGDRVPISTGGFTRAGDADKIVNTQFQYLDVGLSISALLVERQGGLALTVSVDQSSIVTPTEELRAAPNQPMIRQLKMENTVFVTLGKPILVTSVDDPGKANHRYTVDATVTKLNP